MCNTVCIVISGKFVLHEILILYSRGLGWGLEVKVGSFTWRFSLLHCSFGSRLRNFLVIFHGTYFSLLSNLSLLQENCNLLSTRSDIGLHLILVLMRPFRYRTIGLSIRYYLWYRNNICSDFRYLKNVWNIGAGIFRTYSEYWMNPIHAKLISDESILYQYQSSVRYRKDPTSDWKLNIQYQISLIKSPPMSFALEENLKHFRDW